MGIEILLLANQLFTLNLLGFISPFLIVWILVVLAAFAITIYLFNSNNQKRINALNKKLNNYKISLQKAKDTYDNLKKSFENLKKLHAGDEEKIKELNQYIKELEQANKDLLEKKLLAESKIAELEELRKKKDELYAINIHDLKNPINVIKGYVDLVRSYDLTLEEHAQILDSIMRSADKMMDIVSNLTDIISDSSDSEINKEKVSISKIINDVCMNNVAYLKSKNMSLVRPDNDNLPEIEVDPSKIETVIDNLLNNAIKYNPEGTRIEISTKLDDKNLYIEISDNGYGINKEDQESIFEKNKVAKNKPTGGESQTGLGLWIVKQIISEHGGDISLKSEEGKGSTFTVKLPLTEVNLL